MNCPMLKRVFPKSLAWTVLLVLCCACVQAQEPVDILFTDYSMPGMNGIELIEQVSVRWPKIRSVLASGYLDETVQKRLEDFNVSVLSKPYDMQDAAALIIRLLTSPASVTPEAASLQP